MIQTQKQAIDAVKEIKRITRWSYSRIAKRANVHRATIMRLMSDDPPAPSDETMDSLYIVLMAARMMQ